MRRDDIPVDANKQLALEILKILPDNKRRVLDNALGRNLVLTSVYVLSEGVFTVYKEGFYLELFGTRSSFSVYAKDNDGFLEIVTRKPHNSKLHEIYSQSILFDEDDFEEMFHMKHF